MGHLIFGLVLGTFFGSTVVAILAGSKAADAANASLCERCGKRAADFCGYCINEVANASAVSVIRDARGRFAKGGAA